MSNDNRTSNFWTFISKRLGAKAPLADWRLKLGNERNFEKLQKNYLTPTGDMSGLIMCPKQCNPSCGFRKVCEYEGEYEAACRDWPLNSYKIDKTDALIFTVKASALLSKITNIFQISPHIESFNKEEDTWQLGEVPILGCKPATVYLTLNIWEHEITDLIFRFNCKEQRPYILLVTARKAISQTSDAILKDMGAAFVPLNEVLNFNTKTEFELTRECNLAQLVMPPAPKPEPEPENIFRKCGDAWEVSFQGGEKFLLTGVDTGARYIHYLLQHAKENTFVVDIVQCVSGETLSEKLILPESFDGLADGFSIGRLPDGKIGFIADVNAVKQYKKELHDIFNEIIKARESGNDVALKLLQDDLEVVSAVIKESLSPTGQHRLLGDPVLKVANAFRNSLNYAIDKLTQFDKPFSAHLQSAIKCGKNPGYFSKHNIVWSL
ncbi:MAG: hypothetical protein KAS17_02105 [Victivallaceae bacterium]|nr:hypothetical protein [Victivallaceae bacterium]